MEQRVFTGSFKRRKRGLGFAALSWQSQTTYRVSEAGRAGRISTAASGKV